MSPQRHTQEQEQEEERRKGSKDPKGSKERPEHDEDEPPRNVRPHGRGPQEPEPKGRTAQGEKRAPASERMKGKPGGKKGGTTQG